MSVSGLLLMIEDDLRAYRQEAYQQEAGRTVGSESEVYVYLGSQIAAARQTRKWTQADLAALLGESAITVSRWETASRRPSVADLAKMAALGVTIALPILPAQP